MKNKKYGYMILIILFILLNIIAFIIPGDRTSSYLASYIFINIAIIMQIFIWKIALGNEKIIKGKFLSIPIIHISIIYLILEMVIFIISAMIPDLKLWITIIINVVILGIFLILIALSLVGKDEITRIEQKVQTKTRLLKELETEVELIIEKEDKKTQEELKKLVETIRYSDPMSNESLKEIKEKIEELKNSTNKLSLIGDINTLLIEKNKKCKIYKE